jgi:hypothetical protein
LMWSKICSLKCKIIADILYKTEPVINFFIFFFYVDQ